MQVVGLTDFGYASALLRPRHFILNDAGVRYEWSHTTGKNYWTAGAGYNRVHLNQLASRGAVGHYQFSSLRNFLEGKADTEVLMPGSTAPADVRISTLPFSSGSASCATTLPFQQDCGMNRIPLRQK